jgi:predicted RNA binding protein YcfA (HicA-like mRNA interferase family)
MISWKQLEREMMAHGCIFMRQTGSHRLYLHPNYPRPIVVQTHSKSLSKATYKTIMKRIQPVGELV